MNLITVVLWYLWGSGSKIPTDTKSAHAQVLDIKKKKKKGTVQLAFCLCRCGTCVSLPVELNNYQY